VEFAERLGEEVFTVMATSKTANHRADASEFRSMNRLRVQLRAARV
jgi:hypothetical protein